LAQILKPIGVHGGYYEKFNDNDFFSIGISSNGICRNFLTKLLKCKAGALPTTEIKKGDHKVPFFL
jgi:hypothetical protein